MTVRVFASCVHNVVSPGIDREFTIDPAVIAMPEAQCGKRAFVHRTHGFLCIDHYKEQQAVIPPAPRKPFRSYVKHPELLLSEEKYIQRLLDIEELAIAAARTSGTEVIRYGRHEPVSIEFVRSI